MTLERIKELRQELDAERISYGELVEIYDAGLSAGINVSEGLLLADEVLDKLEAMQTPA